MSGPISTKRVRAALVELTAEAGGSDSVVSRTALLKMVKAVDAKGKGAVKEILKRMCKSGEVRKIDDDQYVYVPENAPPADSGEGWTRTYRLAQIAKGPFGVEYIMSRGILSCTAAHRYLKAMVESGYLTKSVENAKNIYWATQLLKEKPIPPPEPKRERVPFIRARAAMAELNSLFVMSELSTKTVRQKVLEQLEILQREFGKDVENDY